MATKRTGRRQLSEEHEPIDKVFDEGLDLSETERVLLLEARYPDRPDLRQEVAALWMADQQPSLTSVTAEIWSLFLREEPPPESFDDFRVIRVLGRGGMGTVYEGHQVSLDRRVALKTLPMALGDPFLFERFQSEIRFLAAMAHPYIATVHGAGTLPDGRPFFFMEFLDGEKLDAWAENKREDILTLVGVMVRVCEGVTHAHSKGIIHRDLKPANIMVVDGAPKIIDFGIAVTLDDESAGGGTPGFMAPEIKAGAKPDVRSDIFALGVVLQQLFKESWGDGRAALELKAIHDKACAADPGLRYQTCSELANDLNAWHEHRPVAAYSRGIGYKISKWGWRHRRGLVVSLLLVSFFGYLGWARLQSEQERVRAETQANIYVQFVQTLFGSIDPLMDGRDVKVLDLVDRMAPKLKDWQGSPEGTAALAEALGISFKELGRFAEARDLFSQALVIWEEQFGAYSERALALRSEVANTNRQLGALDQAEALYRKNLNRKKVSQADRAWLRDAGALADLLAERGSFASSEALFVATLTQAEEQFGPQDDMSLAMLHNFGIMLRRARRLEESRHRLETCRDRWLEKEGADHPRVLSCRHNLALTLNELGLPVEEEYRSILALRRRVLGPSHPDTLETLNNLTNTLGEHGNKEEALRLLREGEAVGRHAPENPIMMRIAHNIGHWELESGNYEAAHAQLELTLQKRREVLGPGHVDTLLTACTLGEVYLATGRFKEAEALFLETYTREKEPIKALQYRSYYAMALAEQDRHPEAIEHLSAVYAGLKNAGSPLAARIADQLKQLEAKRAAETR